MLKSGENKSELNMKRKLPSLMPLKKDLFHNGGQIKYFSVLMPISLSSVARKSKFQKTICFKIRAVGLININTNECKSDRHYESDL